ncbi:MAG TPA: glycosyltransferase family 1 protein [Acidimicrobiales bacterium]|nr:glycosyltransferase family 1 protein [Acidimicrobiales bacterium]
MTPVPGGGTTRPEPASLLPAEVAPAPLGVSIDVSAIPAQPVGAGRYVVELVRALGARPDVELTLESRRGDVLRWRELATGPRILAVAPNPRPARLIFEELALGRVVRRLPGVAVHHAPHYSMPRWSGRPNVVTVHDCTFIDHPEWHERSKVLVFTRALRQAARHAAAVVCPSETTAERFRALCHPAGTVLVVPHGVDHGRFAPVEPEPGADAARLADLARLGIRPPYVLHLGTLEPRKDVATLVRAFARLAAGTGSPRLDGGDLSLVLAGLSGWGGEDLERALGELPEGLARRIVRPGYVADAALPALLRSCSAFVYASLEEGFGVPVLEALACGAPVVTSRGTVMAEVAGEAALLAAPGDAAALAAALEAALEGGEDRARRRLAGLRQVEPMTWEASAAGHVAAYRFAESTGAAAPR